MSEAESISLLGGWEGYRVGTVGRHEAGAHRKTPQVWIELLPEDGSPLICRGCSQQVSAVHDTSRRWVRDLPLLDAETWLLVYLRRVECPECGPKLEDLPWLDRYARTTRRLAESVARLCAVLPIKHVAEFFHLGWDAVKNIDTAYLTEQLGPVDLTAVEVIAMDEFAIQKGHRYATVVAEPDTRRVLWVGRGRGREDVRPFFELLGEGGRQALRAVVMDMNGAHDEEVRAQCAQAEVVYELFHVVAKNGREVIDRGRVDEANRLRADKKTRRVIKGSRWLLLRNRENLANPSDRVRLQELLNANRQLTKAVMAR